MDDVRRDPGCRSPDRGAAGAGLFARRRLQQCAGPAAQYSEHHYCVPVDRDHHHQCLDLVIRGSRWVLSATLEGGIADRSGRTGVLGADDGGAVAASDADCIRAECPVFCRAAADCADRALADHAARCSGNCRHICNRNRSHYRFVIMRMRLAFVFSLLASSALAQSGVAVKQSGNVTPNSVPWWISSGVIAGGVTSADSPISSFGVTNNGYNGICTNSQRITAAGRQTLCMGVTDAGGGKITLQNYGTDTAQPLQLCVNGTCYTPGGTIAGLQVGVTTIGGGINNALFYNNAGVLGNVSPSVFNGNITYVDSGVGPCTAKGDGTTDDAAALRACAVPVAAQTNGGTVGFSCNKVYLLGSKDAAGTGNAIRHPYSNVTYAGCGDSSALKVANSLNTGGSQFFVFYPPDATSTYTYLNIAFRNFKIDENGVNNLTGSATYQNVAIGCNYCTGVRIEGVTFSNNPGSQYVQVGNNSGVNANDVRITNNRFTDACDVIAGSSCTDHSSIFVVADDYSIASNNFTFSSQSIKATAMEMHGITGTAIGNAIGLYNKASNIVAQVGHSGRSLSFVGNSATNVQCGVTCWALNGQTLQGVVIGANTFTRSAEPVGFGLGFIDCGTETTAGTASDIKIIGNTVTGLQAINTAATDPTIVIGEVQNLEVESNLVHTSNGPCIGNNGNALNTSTSWKIRGNRCVDTGATSTAGSRRGILINSGTTIYSFTFGNNIFENAASAYMTTGIDITLNSSYCTFNNDNITNNIAAPLSSATSGCNSNIFNGVMVSQGLGFEPTSTAAMTNGQLLVGQTSAAPLPKTISGSCTVAASGVLTCATMTATTGGLVPTPPNNTTTFLRGDGTFAAVVGADVALTNTHIFVGNASNIATDVAMSGDATLANTGVLTLTSTITAGGPIGNATVAPIITYDAKGRLTTVSSATITPAVGSITGLGTGVATALGVNVATAGSFVTNGGALGSPSSAGTMPAFTLGG